MKKTANNIAKFRKHRKITQQQLSMATGYTQGQICRWEQGANLSIDSAKRISKALNVTVDDLVEVSPFAKVE